MNHKEKNNHPTHIGRYIILNFLGVMIAIYFINLLFDVLNQAFIHPFMTDVMQVDEIALSSTGLVGRLKAFLAIILRILPIQVPTIIKNIVLEPILGALNVTVIAPASVSQYGRFAVSLYYLVLVICMILLVIASILPYVLGGIWFVFIVNKKMNELREIDHMRTLEYEQKRNLLLSDIAHDIKTPITAMTGYAKALSDGLVPENKQQEYLSSIYHKSMRVSELINMMFEYIKLDSTGYNLDIATDDLAEMTREVVADMYQDCEEAGLELDVDIIEENCPYAMDKLQLSRVVTNLISNAIKYLESGDRVLVRLRKLSKNKDNPYEYEISVEDSGTQIDDELAAQIFTPFTRGDKTRSTKGGTGLGLSIAHKIVELHSGELILDRELSDGYTKAFVIKL